MVWRLCFQELARKSSPAVAQHFSSVSAPTFEMAAEVMAPREDAPRRRRWGAADDISKGGQNARRAVARVSPRA